MIGTMRGPISIVKPPRILFTSHERGKNLGEPHQPGAQRDIVRAALRLLETATEPFTQATWPPTG